MHLQLDTWFIFVDDPRLKGPVLVSAAAFNKAVAGDGIGITTIDTKRPLRIPRDGENKHFLIVGDTGSGKSSIIRQMLYQVDARGDSAIVYDPACEFVKQFYNSRRGDIVLNPLDARMPYWNPSKELRRKAEAKALAVSLYQPEGVTNRFFVEAPQKIFAHLLSYLPTPEQLIQWMSNPEEIDRRVRNSEYWALIDPKAPQQRTGVLGSLNMSADSFRLLPKEAAQGPIAPSSPFFVPRPARPPASSLERGAAPAELTVVATAGFTPQWLELFKRQLERVGTRCVVHRLPFPALLRALQHRSFEAALTGFAGFVDPDRVLFEAFHSAGRANYSGLSDPAFDDFVDRARRSRAAEERAELYARACAVLEDLAPAVFLRHGASIIARRSRVTGLDPHPLGAIDLAKAGWRSEWAEP